MHTDRFYTFHQMHTGGVHFPSLNIITLNVEYYEMISEHFCSFDLTNAGTQFHTRHSLVRANANWPKPQTGPSPLPQSASSTLPTAEP